MSKVQFWGVDEDDVNADLGAIEVTEDGTVMVSTGLEWIVAPGSMLPAPDDIRTPGSPSTAPAQGFRKIGNTRAGTMAYVPVPKDGWDGRRWLDKVRYHFRTVYIRPGEVEE